jgi:hypothetical protein
VNVIVVGPAGSGKSTFVKTFSDYLRSKEYDTKAVNLDPASDAIYNAHADVRDFVKAEDVMRRYKLGINGALLKSMELAVGYIHELILNGDFVLYDTPGQMELFLYSKAGIKMLEEISSTLTAGIFLADSEVASTPENFVSILAQCAVVSLRTAIPTLTVFNKCDIADVKFSISELEVLLSKKRGVLAELMEKLLVFIGYTTLPYRVIKISAVKSKGFDDVFSALNELFCSCGDIS